MRSASLSWVGRGVLAVWFSLMVLVGASLLAKHVVALPSVEPTAARKLVALRPAHAPSRWLAVHVLYGACRCSQRIVDHLLRDARPAGWSEVVLWVGAVAPPAELARRFTVHQLSRAQLSALGIEAAPLLIALDPHGQVRYSGGYTDRQQGPVIADVTILNALAQSPAAIAALPVFGCAVSERLKNELSWWRSRADRAER